MGLTQWNPVREMFTLSEAMDRAFEQALGLRGGNGNGSTYFATLPLDAYTTDDEIVVTAAVPGVDPDDVSITIEGESLTIEGEVPARLSNVTYQFTERFHGKFRRTLHLNVPIEEDNVEATFENGILTLVLPKAEEVKPKRIAVKAVN